MARKTQQKAAMERVMAAMQPLAANPEFEKFMVTVREMKDEAVRYLVDHTSVASERESLVARGEVRAYLWFLQTYEDEKERLRRQIEEQRQEQH